MYYLIATVLLNVLISSFFKMFPKYEINALQAIVVNYIVCIITGSLFIGQFPFTNINFHQSWFPWALFLGILFFSIFNLLAFCTKVEGITTTILANKLSLVIPVVFAMFFYHDTIGLFKILGIILAFPAIYLTAKVEGEKNKTQNLWLPLLLFIGGGCLDALMSFVQLHYLSAPYAAALFSIFCFAVAGTIGFSSLVILVLLGKIKLHVKNLFAGIIIGIPNYFSIYFYIKMLHSPFLQTSAAIPVLNIAILVASAITAIILFKEKLNIWRFSGLILAIVAIVLIAFGDKN